MVAEASGHALALLSGDAPAVCGQGDRQGTLLLVRTHEAEGGSLLPTVFTLECGPGFRIISCATLPVDALEACVSGHTEHGT